MTKKHYRSYTGFHRAFEQYRGSVVHWYYENHRYTIVLKKGGKS